MVRDVKLIKIFEYALGQEVTGKNFFETSIQRMGIGSAVTAFQKLVQEEEKHIAFISAILEKLKRADTVELPSEKEIVLASTNFFDDRSRSEFLQQCLEGSMVPEVTIFNTAWLIEKDLSEFYGRMADQTDGKSKDAFTILARWEAGHERFFREYRDKFSEMYSKMPWGG